MSTEETGVTWTGIVKCQRPLYSTGREQRVLVYSQDRVTVFLELPMDKHWERAFGPDYKFYAECLVRHRNEVMVLGRVAEQNW